MLRLQKIAITGGLSSGKTTASRFFKEMGAYVVSADEIVHQILSCKPQIIKQVTELLGTDILVEGTVDRSAIAQKVFKNPILLRQLEHILHPAVEEEIERLYEEASKDLNTPLFIAEVPLLYEAKGEKAFDKVIVVNASKKASRKRFVENKLGTNTQFLERYDQQIPPAVKADQADYVIPNDGNLEQLKEHVVQLFNTLTQELGAQ